MASNEPTGTGEHQPGLRVVVLASGSGTLTQALIDHAAESRYRIVAIGSDDGAAPVLARARAANIATFVVSPKDFPDRASWDSGLAKVLATTEPDLVVSAGFMRLIGARVLEKFDGRIINSHPALLPAFPGAHAVRDALMAGVSSTGTTVHLVDAGMDTGQIIVQQAVEVLPGDTEGSLHERIKIVERRQLVEVVNSWAATGLRGPKRTNRMSSRFENTPTEKPLVDPAPPEPAPPNPALPEPALPEPPPGTPASDAP